MATEVEQLRLSVVVSDPVLERVKKLHGEMEVMTGGQSSAAMEKTKRQAQELMENLVPLYGGLKQGYGMVTTLVGGLGGLGLAVTAIGVVATAAAANVARFGKSVLALRDQQRELGSAAASFKKMEMEWKRARMPEAQISANKRAIAKDMVEIQNGASALRQELLSHVSRATEEEKKNMLDMIERMKNMTPEEIVNEIKRQGEAQYQDVMRRTQGDTVQAAQKRARFFGFFGVEDFERPFKEIKNATAEEKRSLEETIKLFSDFGKQINRINTTVGNIADKLASITLKYTPAIDRAAKFSDWLRGETAKLKKKREEGKPLIDRGDLLDILPGYSKNLPKAEPGWQNFLPDILRPKVQKQSYSGGTVGGASIILASYEQSTAKVRDETRVTIELTRQFKDLNAFLRLGGGGGGTGGGAIRASLGITGRGAGGGGGGYGSGTGTRGTGGGRTGNDTIGPSTGPGPPSIPGMPGVRPGDVGIANMVREGKVRPNQLASLLGPGGQPQIAVPPSLGGGGGGVMAGLTAAPSGGAFGAVGPGPRTGVPSLKMPELPYGVPYGGGGGGPTEPPGGVQAPGQWDVRADIPYNGVDAAIRYKNPGAHVKASWSQKWGTTGYGWLNDNLGGHTIQRYPTWAQGIAANIDLINRSKFYKGRTISAAISKWSDGGRSTIPGYDSNEVITEKHLSDPKFLRSWFFGESPKMKINDDDIQTAIRMFKAGSLEAYKNDPSNPKLAGGQRDSSSPTTTPPMGSGGGTTGGRVTENVAAGRRDRLPISDDLREVLTYAGRQAGVDFDVFAGRGHPGKHGHSYRHDYRPGFMGSADVNPRDPETGRVLDPRVSADRARIEKAIEESVAAGAEGIGHGPGYMSPETGYSGIHIGGGSPNVWGSKGRSANAPAWVVQAWKRGQERRMRMEAVREANKQATSTATAAAAAKVPSFADLALKKKPFIDVSKIDRALGTEVKSRVDGRGEIEVDVKGPAGTKVTAETPRDRPNIFKRASVNRVKEVAEPKGEDKPATAVGRTASRTDEE